MRLNLGQQVSVTLCQLHSAEFSTLNAWGTAGNNNMFDAKIEEGEKPAAIKKRTLQVPCVELPGVCLKHSVATTYSGCPVVVAQWQSTDKV